MSFKNMSDEQIIKEIANSIEKKRLQKKIKASELAKIGGFNAQTYSNFINKHSDIKLSTLIQIIKALGELDKLESLFNTREVFNPLTNSTKTIKRVRTTKRNSLECKRIDSNTSKGNKKSASLSFLFKKYNTKKDSK